MAAFEDRIIQNINSLIYLLRSQGIKAISTIKFLFLLNKFSAQNIPCIM